MSEICKSHNACRVCGSENLVEYLDLGMMPLPNNLEPTQELAKSKERFPLKMMVCDGCYLSQLSVVISPKELFSYYTYRSGINKGYIDHCRKMAEDLSLRFNLNEKTFHIDIAGNDGTLLYEFKEVLNHRVLNVDPAENLALIAEQKGIPTKTKFWELPIIYDIGERADLLTATNVFAHLDNVKEFIVTCKAMMKTDSLLVIENPYLIDFIDNMEWDTVYHEHISYWSLFPMMQLCGDYGLKVISAEKQEIHGGSMRYIITRKESKYEALGQEIHKLLHEEYKGKFDIVETYMEWGKKVINFIGDFRNKILQLKEEGNIIIGFAASAKGVTLLNASGMDSNTISCIIDETPEKLDKFSPGTGIRILYIDMLMKLSPDYILILSWNFKKDIISKIKNLGYRGKFIIPIPKWEII